jgi:hypothetical protein
MRPQRHEIDRRRHPTPALASRRLRAVVIIIIIIIGFSAALQKPELRPRAIRRGRRGFLGGCAGEPRSGGGRKAHFGRTAQH